MTGKNVRLIVRDSVDSSAPVSIRRCVAFDRLRMGWNDAGTA